MENEDIRVLPWQFVAIVRLDLQDRPHQDGVPFVGAQYFFAQPLAVDLEALETVRMLLGSHILCSIPEAYIRLVIATQRRIGEAKHTTYEYLRVEA